VAQVLVITAAHVSSGVHPLKPRAARSKGRLLARRACRLAGAPLLWSQIAAIKIFISMSASSAVGAPAAGARCSSRQRRLWLASCWCPQATAASKSCPDLAVLPS
jgi:hypothetical protein